jgi:hypothetical protein
MKYYFTLLFSSLFCLLNSQTYPSINRIYGDMLGKEQLFDSSMAANNYHVKTRIYTRFNKKGKSRKNQEIATLKYDDKGFLTQYEETNTRKKKSERFDYFYKDSLPSGYDHYKNNKLVKRYEIIRSGSKMITDVVIKNSKNITVSRQHYDYDKNINRLTRNVIYNKKNKEERAIEYTYYDAKTMKQAKEFRNGKLKKVWNYTCDPAGLKEEKAKEMKVCKNVNVDANGNRVETNRIVNPKGEIELRVNTFDKNDRMIKQVVHDDIKHRLISEWSYTRVNDNWEMVYISYNKRGKQQYYNKAVFTSWERILSNEYISGVKKKYVTKNVFEYNEKRLMTRYVSFDEKNRKISENIHTFN